MAWESERELRAIRQDAAELCDALGVMPNNGFRTAKLLLGISVDQVVDRMNYNDRSGGTRSKAIIDQEKKEMRWGRERKPNWGRES